MSKEEVLLELVVDNFSSIRELLDATKDIEEFLIEFKLNKKTKGLGTVINRAKNLVDTLSERSVKIRDDFHKYYNVLEVPAENEVSIEDKIADEDDRNSVTAHAEQDSDTERILPNETNIVHGSPVTPVSEPTPEAAHLTEAEHSLSEMDSTVEADITTEDTPKTVDSSSILQTNLVEDNPVSPTSEENLAKENSTTENITDMDNCTLEGNFVSVGSSTTEDDSSAVNPAVVENEDEDPLINNEPLQSDSDATDAGNIDTNEGANCDSDENESLATTKNNINPDISQNGDPLSKDIETEHDTLDTNKELRGDSEDMDKTNESDLAAKSSDRLEISEENEKAIDDTTLEETEKADENSKESEKENAGKDEENNENMLEIKTEPKIRLVDLSKLIDPKPKKSVKFDSSVIILTSSDEETPKKKIKVKERNGKLKSALKSSPNTKMCKDTQLQSETDKNKIKPSSKGYLSIQDSGSEESKNSSSDTEARSKKSKKKKGNDKLGKKSSLSKKSQDSDSDDSENCLSNTETKAQQKTKRNKARDTSEKKGSLSKKKTPRKYHSDSEVEEQISSDTEENGLKKSKNKLEIERGISEKSEDSDSDIEADEDKKEKNIPEKEKSTKTKHSKSKENSSNSEGSDAEPSKKKKKTENDDSDISDCVIQDRSRRSSRVQNKHTKKENRREQLKTLFKRKIGKSSFEIVNRKADKKSKGSDSNNSDSDSNNTQKQRPHGRKKDLVEEHLSDTSSLSDNENTMSLKEMSKKINKQSKLNLRGDKTNNKFDYEVYIPLPRFKCERIKEIYLNNKEILEIKRLRNIDMPKSSKRSRKSKNDSKSSSDNEKPKSKKSKNTTLQKESDAENFNSDDEPSANVILNDDKTAGNEKKPIENTDEKMADILVDEMRNVNNEEKKSEESDTESDGKNTSKKRNKNKKDGSCDKENECNADKEKDDVEEGNAKENDDDKDEDKKSEDDSISSDSQKKKDKKKWRSDKLLNTKIDSSDSEEEFSKFCKKKDKSREEIMRKTKKRIRRSVVISDSDDSDGDKNKDKESSDEEKSSTKSSSEDEEEEKVKQKPRRRIRKAKDSSSSSEEDKSTRKHIRRVLGKDSLSETTKQAEAEEKERKARIAEKQKKYNQIYENINESKVEKVVLDYDEQGKKEELAVHKSLVKKLKPHQASGVQFMWDACFESVKRAKTTEGSGCILAHCMGLGKTLQVITLVHTLLMESKRTGMEKVLVVCPLNTVLNWKSEFKKWLPKKSEIEIFELVSCKQNYERQYIVQEWHNDGGVLIIGYTMFRNLSNPDNKRISKKMRKVFQEGLLDPGPDLVVCDEGHLLKNEKTHLSIAMNRIRTLRRIVLTGTPLQNNLKEYWCMVQFIKPNLLGTYKEYLNRFVNPITNGQYTDSTQHDIMLMRKRSHVLHKLLDGVVQRRDYGVLEPYLPPKHEYVLFINLTETQIKLYKHYMEKFARRNDGSNRTSFLFTDFQQLQRICTHPRVLLDKSNEKKEKFGEEDSDTEGSLKDFIDDGDGSTSSSENDSSSKSGSESGSDKDKEKKSKPSKSNKKGKRVTRAQAAMRRENNEDSDPEIEEIKKEWWQEYCDGDELDNINNSGKLFLLFQILKECEEIGDKILIFSQSLYTLNCIEYFLQKIDEATQAGDTEKVGGHSGSWSLGLDYFRIDGSSSCDNRAVWCDNFNNPDNIRARLFLISTKAGGLGINLVAANRVIIFDVSWNPSHDIQSIYRIYRFGQTKPCYIYRFVTYGTMEMKIYERQVTKQAISKRVIDEQQIDRHYNQNDLQELYKCDLEPEDRPIPLVPKDVLLGELLQKYDQTIYKYHLHQSLLENKEAEGLNEEERKAAWEEFENEKVLRKNTNPHYMNMNAHAIAAALSSIVRKDNPTWSDVQIKGIIPALVQQLQVQLSEGDVTMYTRVQQEMQIMQAMQAQKMKDAYFQQQVMRMIQQQQQHAKNLGNMNVDPRQLAMSQAGILTNYLSGPNARGGPSMLPPPLAPLRMTNSTNNDVIELND